MIVGALYVNRDSPIHRLRPGWKLLALPVLGTALFATSNLVLMAAALVLVLGFYGVARMPWRLFAGQIHVVAPILVLFFLVQLWLAGLGIATITVVRFLALILAASLVTLTTRTSDMIDTLESALSRFAFLGVDAPKVSLSISLVMRFVPVVAEVLAEVREAQAARGRERSLFALAVPVVVRTLKMADEIAEAIDARS